MENKKNILISNGNTTFTFLPSGDLKIAESNGIMLNQVVNNVIDGAMNNIYLRILDEKITYFPLLGINSVSHFSATDNQVTWLGCVNNIDFEVHLILASENTWFWNVNLFGNASKVDLVFGFDLGLARKGALQSNEAYVSQYIDHSVFETPNGPVICSRQNQSENLNPYMQLGMLEKANSFSVDGFQFFTENYRLSNTPSILSQEKLEDKIYQYEFAYTALQSVPQKLDGQLSQTFYQHFEENYSEAVKKAEYFDEIAALWKNVTIQHNLPLKNTIKQSNEFGEILVGLDLQDEELDVRYGQRIQEEIVEGKLISFFTNEKDHIVLRRKELLVERPHGHILFSKNETTTDIPLISSTTWMDGVFNSQVTFGNTKFNKLLSNSRNHLNILKTSGQRIYVKIQEKYHLFTIPSIYEIGINHTKWVYKTEFDTFEVLVFTSSKHNVIKVEVTATSGKNYEYLISNQIVMGETENEQGYSYVIDGNDLNIYPEKGSILDKNYPGFSFRLTTNSQVEVNDGNIFLDDYSEPTNVLVLRTTEVSNFEMEIQGTFDGEFTESDMSFENERKTFHKFFTNQTNNFKLSLEDTKKQTEIEKLNLIIWWYTHNMFVHYLVPRGLEQYGGAAWGTRDVSQGPIEFFTSMQKFDIVREIILKVYSHQFVEDGKWPQWFMFDDYKHVFADESHGDVIVWPLKVIADYLERTNDLELLNEKVPYMSKISKEFTTEKATILDHINKQLDYISNNMIHDTGLSSYDDGDWNDTLQPANSKLKKYLISAWTVELTYEMLNKLEKNIGVFKEIYDKVVLMKNLLVKDFNTYIIKDDIVPGFLYLEDKENPKYIIHPTDKDSGIQYRMLPMIQGIQSEIFTTEQAIKHKKIIKNELLAPDGARLMNRPTTYTGGVSVTFKRAEQASNFGREVGIMYVHAHIRYIEAMAKLGDAEAALKAIFQINPINISRVVKNAQLRQSNSYFSSSDAMFNTRYEAQENYNRVLDGSIGVKGGWKIYSSGPGIYINQVVSNILGVRLTKDGLYIDPTISEDYDGLMYSFDYKEFPIKITYHSTNSERRVLINNEEIIADQVKEKYRQGGFLIDFDKLSTHLRQSQNHIEVYI